VSRIHGVAISVSLIRPPAEEPSTPASLLSKLKGIGPEFALLRWLEALCSAASPTDARGGDGGLAHGPWAERAIEQDQGISKSGNHRLRRTMIKLAWSWLRYQPRR
jgi:transposase